MISRSFTGADLPFVVAHVEQIGRHELVAGRFGIGGGQRGIGAGLVGEDLAVGQDQHPAAALPIEHVAVAQAVGGQHLKAVNVVRHGAEKPLPGHEIKTSTCRVCSFL